MTRGYYTFVGYRNDVRVIVYHGIELNIDVNLFLVHWLLPSSLSSSSSSSNISLNNALALRWIAGSTTLAIFLHLTLSGRTRRANSIKGSEIRTKKSAFPPLAVYKMSPDIGRLPLEDPSRFSLPPLGENLTKIYRNSRIFSIKSIWLIIFTRSFEYLTL